MKIKFEKDRKKRTESLVVRTTKGEALDYAQAELARAGAVGRLLPLSYEERRGEAAFAYDVTDTIPVEVYLRADIALSQFRSLLEDVADALEACTALDLDPTRLLFSQGAVRIGAEGDRVLFAYVPADGLPSDRDTVRDLLLRVAEGVSFVCEADRQDAASLLDYLRRNAVFSALDFKGFLASTAFGRSGADASDALPAVAPKAATGTYDFVKAQSGSPSALEARGAQSLAERVASEVARVPGARHAAHAAPATAEAADRLSAAHAEAAPKGEPARPTAPFVGFFLVRVRDGGRHALPEEGAVSVGRSKRCDVRVEGNGSLSRRHAELFVEDGTCFVRDCGSTNGTFAGGARLQPGVAAPLARGSALRLADEEFRIE